VKPTQRRLMRESRVARRALGAAALLALIQAVLTVVWAVALAAAVAPVVMDGAGLSQVRTAVIVAGCAAVGRAMIAWGFEATGRVGAQQVMSELRLRLTAHVLEARPLSQGTETIGGLATVAVQGVDGLELVFARYFPQMMLAVIVPVAAIGWIIPTDWISAAILIVTIPVIIIFMILIGLGSERRAKARWAAMQMLGGRFFEVVRGLTTLRVHDRAEAQVAVLEEVGEAYRRETMSTLRLAFLSALVLELAAALGTAMVAVALGVRLVDGGIGLQASLAVLILAPEIYQPIRQLGAQFHASADGMIAAEEIFAVLDAPAVLDEASGERVAAPSPTRETIVFDGVGVAYPGRVVPALAGIQLSLAPGEFVALVGPSGAGKSTIANLLVRLIDPTTGAVRIGGQDLRQVDADAWRRRIAWVPQRPRIFAASVADNVRVADPGASDDAIREALRQAGAEELVDGFAEGLATRLGEGGRRLSAGEAQRISLARAFLRRAELFVLDEPTAHLDGVLAAELALVIRGLTDGATTLAVTHRLELVHAADRVVQIDNGRVMAAGPVGVPA
jgi:ATP-binding cassette subfamily C protein CydCD